MRLCRNRSKGSPEATSTTRPRTSALKPYYFDDPAKDVCAQAIFPDFARLMGERQARQNGNEIRQRRVASVCGRVRPAIEPMDRPNPEIGGCVRKAPFRIRKIQLRIDEARRMAQQISNRHRAFRAFW